MKLVELIAQTCWKDVRDSLLSNYPDSLDNIDTYSKVYDGLLKLTPFLSKMMISISEEFNKDFDDEPYTSVSGKDISDNSNIEYAIELVSWDEWLGMTLEDSSLKNYSHSDIIAHCIWEMTFYGFTNKTVQSFKDELNRRATEVQNMTEKEKKENLISLEELKERLKIVGSNYD
ncbi:MAG: hypothetical protein B6229_09755 [Spirochaetaceae bacterium 4572_7]|nr:MAG: hypothetical protein B6229_09755 [Spirochaetaceae bacterium 4572_7]